MNSLFEVSYVLAFLFEKLYICLFDSRSLMRENVNKLGQIWIQSTVLKRKLSIKLLIHIQATRFDMLGQIVLAGHRNYLVHSREVHVTPGHDRTTLFNERA